MDSFTITEKGSDHLFKLLDKLESDMSERDWDDGVILSILHYNGPHSVDQILALPGHKSRSNLQRVFSRLFEADLIDRRER